MINTQFHKATKALSSIIDTKSIYNLLLNQHFDFSDNKTIWFEIIQFYLCNLSYRKSINISLFLENFKFFLIQNSFSDYSSLNQSVMIKRAFELYFSSFSHKILKRNFNSTTSDHYIQFLYIFSLILYLEYNPFNKNESLVEKLFNIYKEFQQMLKLNNNYKNIIQLTVLVIQKIIKKYIEIYEKDNSFTLLESKSSKEKLEINNNSTFNILSQPKNHPDYKILSNSLQVISPFNCKNEKNEKISSKDKKIDYKNETEQLSEKIISPFNNKLSLVNSSSQNIEEEKSTEEESPQPAGCYLPQKTNSIGFIANKFYSYKRYHCIKLKSIFSSITFDSFIKIGSNSLKINFSDSNLDLLYLPKKPYPKIISLFDIEELFQKYFTNDEIISSKSSTDDKSNGLLLYHLINPDTKEIIQKFNIHVGKQKYLLCNNLMRKIFLFESNLAILHIFYQKIMLRLGLSNRFHLSLLIIAFSDYAYNIFDLHIKNIKEYMKPKYIWKSEKFEFEEEQCYYFNYNKEKLNALQLNVGLKELIVNFLDFVIQITLTSDNRKVFPSHLFDDNYIFNIREPLCITKKCHQIYSNYIPIMEDIKNKMQSNYIAHYEEIMQLTKSYLVYKQKY